MHGAPGRGVRGGDPHGTVVQQPQPRAALPGQHAHPVGDAVAGQRLVQGVGDLLGRHPVGDDEEGADVVVPGEDRGAGHAVAGRPGVRGQPLGVEGQQRAVGPDDPQVGRDHPVVVAFAAGEPARGHGVPQDDRAAGGDRDLGALVEAGIRERDQGVRQVLDVRSLVRRQVDPLAGVVVFHPEHLGRGLGGQVHLAARAAPEVHPVAVGLGDAAAGGHQADVGHAGHGGVGPQRPDDLERCLLVPLHELGAPTPHGEGQVEDADLGRGAGGERVRHGSQGRHLGGQPFDAVVPGGEPVGPGPVRGGRHVRSAPCGVLAGSRPRPRRPPRSGSPSGRQGGPPGPGGRRTP